MSDADTYAEIAQRVVRRWSNIFAADQPLREEICRLEGLSYPVAAVAKRAARDKGIVSPKTDFEECIANARSYAGPHLLQLAQALDHECCLKLRSGLGDDHEVMVVDVGCAGGILGLLSDRSGFSHYVGIDTNHWMRAIAWAAMMSTCGTSGDSGVESPDRDFYGGSVARPTYAVSGAPGRVAVREVVVDRPSVTLINGIGSSRGWIKYVRNLSASTCLDRGRPVSVLAVMNHLLFQTTDVVGTVRTLLDECSRLASLANVKVHLLSIEPTTLYKPDRYGSQGFDRTLRQTNRRVVAFEVDGVGQIWNGNRTTATVRLVDFEAASPKLSRQHPPLVLGPARRREELI